MLIIEYNNRSKNVDDMLRKQIIHLTLACDFDIEHTELKHIHITSLKGSSYSDIQACVPQDPGESLQCLSTFCRITWL